MKSRRDWPKPDLLQQRRLELGLPLDPAPAPPPLSLLLKGGMGAVVLVMHPPRNLSAYVGRLSVGRCQKILKEQHFR